MPDSAPKSQTAGGDPSESAEQRRELVFGFVSPLGVNRDIVIDALRVALRAAEYSLEKIKVSEQLEPFIPSGESATSMNEYLARKKRLMDAGDSMRQRFSARYDDESKRGDAAALAAVIKIRDTRFDVHVRALPKTDDVGDPELKDRLESTPLGSTAFLIDSLKHPDELRLLKRIYGPAFISVGIYEPPEMRKSFLLEQAGVNASDHDAVRFAESLLHRDESGQDEQGHVVPLGQDVSDAFYATDFILDATKQKHEVIEQLTRLVELIFGNLYLTPSKEELGMFLARAAQVRSGSLARQIGAAIMRDDGSVVSIGTNEVARPISGGQYWFDDDHLHRGRDLVYQPQDTSDEFREEMVEDLLRRLDEAGALSDLFATKKSDDTILDGAEAKKLRDKRLQELYFEPKGPLRKALLRDNLDYVRTVHAEGAAIIDAARHGVGTLDTTMFTTTFPCHECARHIVAAGIKEVVYLAPYPKSAVKHLYRDSIQVDPQSRDVTKLLFRTFVGVAPSRYLEFFTTVRERKTIRGFHVKFELRTEIPRLPYYTPDAKAASTHNEKIELYPFREFLKTAGPRTQPQL